MASKSAAFIANIAARRTIYALKKESPIPDAKIQEIITQALLHVPSSFNSQSSRIILLVKGEHDKLWDITKEVLKGVVPAEQYPSTEARLNGFQAGYGTVLFFTARSAVQTMQQKFAIYADRFPGWATQSDGMHQYAVWTALEAEGLGANLQHYNPLIDAKVAAEWNVDPDWELSAQLVFGAPAGEAGEKTHLPIEDRFKTYGA
ncbi:nitroreductase family protein [Phlyctema vagabunda]|uniref:Nitroreductase family protein n=1 Tax=Phlyctema vagabunda TaxID=108571 RepID=A0ABR4PNI8_9HELO